MKSYLLFSVFLFFHTASYSQCLPADVNCDPALSAILPVTDEVDFLFDSFSEYNGGIYKYASTIIKIRATNNPAVTCKWKLKMIVSNNGHPAPGQWNPLATYGGGGGLSPTLDMLEIRVTNACQSSPIDDTWVKFSIPPGDGDEIDIITNLVAIPGGFCNINSNGAGTYLGPDYGEYSFQIDYRIVPGFNWVPGYYNLSVKFCFTE